MHQLEIRERKRGRCGVIFWRCPLGDTRQGGFRANRPRRRCGAIAVPTPPSSRWLQPELSKQGCYSRKLAESNENGSVATIETGSAIGNSADEPGFSAAAGSLPGQLGAAEYGRIIPRSRPFSRASLASVWPVSNWPAFSRERIRSASLEARLGRRPRE
jgi:hypothetical protein